MAELKKYTSFEGLKSDVKSGGVNRTKDIIFLSLKFF